VPGVEDECELPQIDIDLYHLARYQGRQFLAATSGGQPQRGIP
jgi:hypothetical protein